MCPLFETIKCNNGKLFNMEFHQERFEKSSLDYFGNHTNTVLEKVIEIPGFARAGLFRCRVTYSSKIEKIEFIPHQYRKIKSLKIVEDQEIEYHFKSTGREKLNALFDKRGTCDDIIIVKNGFITDSSFANLVFFDGKNWFTPDTPLLRGTQRARLITGGKIRERRIVADDLSGFMKAGLINALNDLEEMPQIEISDIHL